MSEIPTINHSRIYFWTLFIFVLLQLPTGYAVNMAMLLVFRFLTGFFDGPVLATGGATIIDISTSRARVLNGHLWRFWSAGSRVGSTGWRVCCPGKRVALNYLGACMAVRSCLDCALLPYA